MITHEEIYAIVIPYDDEIDKIKEIKEIDYGYMPSTNEPCLILKSIKPPTKKLAKQVDNLLQHVPHYWWPVKI